MTHFDDDRPLAGWTPPPPPGPQRLEGRYARLEWLSALHVPDIHDANRADDAIWRMLWCSAYQMRR